MRNHQLTRFILLTYLLSAAAFRIGSARAESEQPAGNSRNFYSVLDDLLGDFEYELKNGNVTGLKDLAIRNVAMSENVPASFRSHLELVVTERLMQNNRTRVLQCLPCKSKRSFLSGDQMVITTPDSNPAEMTRIARQAGIANFMDIAFSFQPGGMLLSMYIIESDTGTVVWSRSYNSETSRASAFRRGVDHSQLDDARRASEYVPVVQYRAILYYMYQRNPSAYVGTLGVGIRGVERYDNRKKEVGFELDFFKDASTIVNSAAANPAVKNLYGGLNLTLLFMHAWNLIGEEENYNRARGSFSVGVGGTYASGFLGGLIRSGYEWRLAKHWAVSGNLGFRPPASAFIGATSAGRVSGVEFGIGIHALF